MTGTLSFANAGLGLACASVLAVICAYLIRRGRAAHRAWVERAARVTGTVVSIRETGDAETLTEYSPVIVYRVDGHEFSIDGERSHSPEQAVGATVEVAYNPLLPSDARVVHLAPWDNYDRVMAIVIFLFVAGLATIVITLVRG